MRMLVDVATDRAAYHADNEDFAAAGPDAAVVLDGAGVPQGVDNGCVHGVAWFARTLGSTLLAEVTGARPLADCLASAIADVAARHADTCDLTNPLTPSATVAVLRIRGHRVEYLVLSDAVLVISPTAGAPIVVTDDAVATAGQAHRGELDRTAIGTDEHADARRRYVLATARHRNRPGGFWIASADPEAAAHAVTGTVPADGLLAAVLMTDGASRLVDLFGLATWDELAVLVRESGSAELIRRVRAAEADDPLGRRRPRPKAQDDATAVLCRFG